MAQLIVALEDGVVRRQLVVDEFHGVTGTDSDGAGFEGKHAGVGAKLHFDGCSLSGTNVEADQHQEGAAGSCKGANHGPHWDQVVAGTLRLLLGVPRLGSPESIRTVSSEGV